MINKTMFGMAKNFFIGTVIAIPFAPKIIKKHKIHTK